MKKSELIEALNKIPGDFTVTFRNVEYGGYEEINGVYVEKSHRITEDGRKRCPETGTDYSAQQTVRKGRMDLYEEETCDIIVVDVMEPWSRTRFDS